MSTINLTTGSQIAVPFPAPYTLESDNPSVVAITLDRSNATLKALAPGAAWLTLGVAGDLQVKLSVVVQDPSSSASSAAKQPAAAHR